MLSVTVINSQNEILQDEKIVKTVILSDDYYRNMKKITERISNEFLPNEAV